MDRFTATFVGLSMILAEDEKYQKKNKDKMPL
jgi:hypothetical protein